MGEGSACFFRPCSVLFTCFADQPAQVKALPEQLPVSAFRLKWNLVESNHVLMLFRHALNDRTSSGSMMSGSRGARTLDLLVNSQALFQLGYTPENVLFTCQCTLCCCHPRRVPVFFICRCRSRVENVRLERSPLRSGRPKAEVHRTSWASSCSRSMRATITPHSRK